MKLLIKIVGVTTVLAMTTSLPNVYHSQHYPSYKQEQQWRINRPSYTIPDQRPNNPDWTTRIQDQRYPDRNYLPRSYQEDDYSTSHSAPSIYPKVKTIEIKSGPGPREYKLPLNGDPSRIEIHQLNPEIDEPSSPDSHSVKNVQNNVASVKNMELIHHNSDGKSYIIDVDPKDSEPENKDIKIRVVSEDQLRPEDVNSNKVKVIRLNTTEYREADIPKSLPPAVREVLKMVLASLRKKEGIAQENVDESKSKSEIAKTTSESIKSPRNNKESSPLYSISKKHRKTLVVPTPYDSTQNNLARNVPNESFNQATLTSVKTQATPTKRKQLGPRKNYYLVPIISNRNSETYDYIIPAGSISKYQPLSKSDNKSMDNNKHYDHLIPANETISSDKSAHEFKESSKPTEAVKNERKSDAVFPKDTEKSNFTEPSFISETLSTTDKYDSSSTLIIDGLKQNSSSPDVTKPVSNVTQFNTLNSSDATLPKNEPNLKSEDHSPNKKAPNKEASIKVAETEANIIEVTDKSAYEPLTLEILSTTDNCSSSSKIVPDHQQSNSSSSALDEIKPLNNVTHPNIIPADKTFPEDDSKSISGDHIFTPTTETNSEDIKFKAVPSVDAAKSVPNDSYSKALILANEKSDSSHLEYVDLSSSYDADSLKVVDYSISISDIDDSDYDDFSEAPLTFETLSTTDNYVSSTIIPDSLKSSSSSQVSDENNPDDFARRSYPKISDNETLSKDVLDSVSVDHSPADIEDIKSKETFFTDSSKIVSNNSDSKPLQTVNEKSDTHIETNDIWIYTQPPPTLKETNNSVSMYREVALPDDARNDKSYTPTPGSSVFLSENVDKQVNETQTTTEKTNKSIHNQEIPVTENNENIPKTHSDNVSMKGSGSEQRVIDKESVQKRNGTDNVAPSDTKEKNTTYILEDTKVPSDNVLGEYKSDAYFNAKDRKQDSDSLIKVNDASVVQENISTLIQSEDDMTPLSFVVNLIINFCKGGDSVTKMFRDSKVQDFVSKHIPILNIQIP